MARGAISASLEGSLPRPSTAPRTSASLEGSEAYPRGSTPTPPRSRVTSLPSRKRIDSISLEVTPRRKVQTAICSPTRRTEALNANNSAAAPGSDGVWPPLRATTAPGVPSANSGHCSTIPGAVATLWEHATHCANVRGAAPSTVLPTLCTSSAAGPSNGMGTTLGRGSSLDQIKTPACRTLGMPPRQSQGTVLSAGATMPPAGAARTPA